MKRKIFIACISILLLVSFGASALVYDNINGLTAEAGYMGKNWSDEKLDNMINQMAKDGVKGFSFVYKIGKLSKAEREIMYRALLQYDLSPGEVYAVTISSYYVPGPIILYYRVDSFENGNIKGCMSDITRWKRS